MKIQSYATSHVGQRRQQNEDYMLVDPDLGLYMVCDGMGGHAAGEVASSTAAHITHQYIKDRRHVIDEFDDTMPARLAIVRMVDQAIKTACAEVHRIATEDLGKNGMGTTLTLLLVAGTKGIMGHVGDSRLYLRRDGTLHQLSEDHSFVNELIKQGMAPEKARLSALANRITRAVGIGPTVQVDTLVFDILPEDLYLICSDGLSRYFEEGVKLLNALGDYPLEELADALVERANAEGGRDNITAVVVSAYTEDAQRHADVMRTEEITLQMNTLTHVDLFQDLNMREQVAVHAKLSTVEYGVGETVIQEGEDTSQLYMILEGSLAVSQRGKRLSQLISGDHFGEMAIFSNRPRSATVTALERSRLLVMEKDAFNRLVTKDKGLGIKLLWRISQVMASRLEAATSDPESA